MIGFLGMRGTKVFAGAAASALLIALTGPMPALADTIEAALVRAYQTNPQLNSQRAQVRVTDENVPQALSGYRPKVAVTASRTRAAESQVSAAREALRVLEQTVLLQGATIYMDFLRDSANVEVQRS